MGDDPADTAQLLRLMGLESPTARVPFLFLLGLAAGESWGQEGGGTSGEGSGWCFFMGLVSTLLAGTSRE